MNNLLKQAQAIRQRRAAANRMIDPEEEQKREHLAKVLASFEECFAPELELLREAGITASAKFNEYRYYQTYICLEKDGRQLKMDYMMQDLPAPVWRYEHVTDGRATMQFDDWGKEGFITWVAEYFFPEHS